MFAGKQIEVRYHNTNGKEYGDYHVTSAVIDGNTAFEIDGGKAYLDRNIIINLNEGVHVIDVELK